jgi:uncharacterized membrane protein HdeD (DUF308 family)
MNSATALETRQSPWWLLLMGGILNVGVGVLLVANPLKTTIAFAWVLGLYWFVQGIFLLVGMFLDRSAWGWKLFMGVIGIMAGIFVMRHPIASAVALPAFLILFLGIQGVITGAIELLLAFRGGGWGMGIWGVLSVVFGIILILNWTSPSMVLTFIWIVGMFAIIAGIAEIFQAFRQRRAVGGSDQRAAFA